MDCCDSWAKVVGRSKEAAGELALAVALGRGRRVGADGLLAAESGRCDGAAANKRLLEDGACGTVDGREAGGGGFVRVVEAMLGRGTTHRPVDRLQLQVTIDCPRVWTWPWLWT